MQRAKASSAATGTRERCLTQQRRQLLKQVTAVMVEVVVVVVVSNSRAGWEGRAAQEADTGKFHHSRKLRRFHA